MTPRRTLEDHIREHGPKDRSKLPAVRQRNAIGRRREPNDDVPLRYPCPCCGKFSFPFEIVFVPDVDELEGDYACTTCFADIEREKQHGREKAKKNAPIGWDDNDEANTLRARRNHLVDTHLWAVLPGSPLTEASQAEFSAWLAKMHAMTVTTPDPRAWIFPDRPTPVYKPVPQQQHGQVKNVPQTNGSPKG